MEYSHHLTLVLLLVATITSHALMPAEVYWKNMFPNTPMPKSLRNFVRPAGTTKASYGVMDVLDVEPDKIRYGPTKAGVMDELEVAPDKIRYGQTKAELYNVNVSFFYLEKDLAEGNKMTLKFRTPIDAPFLSRKAANTLPFSSDKMPEILKYFNAKPDSKEAQLTKSAIEVCEKPPIKREHKYCATSLESMIDFSVQTLGRKSKVISTDVDKEVLPVQKFTIIGVSKLLKSSSITCHKLRYAYAVHYCHENLNHEVRLYEVPLVADDGTKFTAYAVCHINTSDWSPMHLAFQLLNVKPGTVPVCHFLARDTLLWVPN